MTLLEELESLPAYLHDNDEENRPYLMITRDISGGWNACYETEGRCYYPVSDPDLNACIKKLQEELK